MRPARLALVVATALAAGPGVAGAQPPPARLAGVIGLRQNVGAFGDRYGWGLPVFGLEASYLPMLSGRLGLVGYVIASAHWEGHAKELNTAGDLWLVQMGLGPRLRLFAGSTGDAAIYLELTGEMVRSNYTIPPDGKRSYFGPSVGLGLEFEIAAHWVVSFSGRFGVLANGPGGLAIHPTLCYGD